jgi:hypothetical protein
MQQPLLCLTQLAHNGRSAESPSLQSLVLFAVTSPGAQQGIRQCQVLVAAVTKQHQSISSQHTGIVAQFWRSESDPGLIELKSAHWQALFLLEAPGEDEILAHSGSEF